MELKRSFLIASALALGALCTTLVSARAVNISNTWMLPEEGFPVFYRYFRDRISWYEADAVCQFHHANLVTADAGSQYDAIRAYLKELDITESVWIGLSRTAERPNFVWTDFSPLSGEGHWHEQLPKGGGEALCVVMDPAADFLWRPLQCGGPEVASFICEMPVPSWAMGPRGCLLTELPSLTVLYIPEQLALELTSDCGLDGTKKIACKGNADRDEILHQLTCAMSPDDFSSDDRSTNRSITATQLPPLSHQPGSVTSQEPFTSNTIDADYATRHRRETEDTASPWITATRTTTDISASLIGKSNNKSTEEDFDGTTRDYGVSAGEDVTLDSSVLSTVIPSSGFSEFAGVSTGRGEEVNSRGADELGEYPSAINQGQLFSIVENGVDNGTMFDIIELNETTPEDSSTSRKQSTAAPVNSSSAHNLLYTTTTTVVYHKEPPPSEISLVTNKSPRKSDKPPTKKDVYMMTLKKKPVGGKKTDLKSSETATINNSNVSSDLVPQTSPPLLSSKEIDINPILTGAFVKLNRTFRKEVPPAPLVAEEDDLTKESQYGTPILVNFTDNNQLIVAASDKIEPKSRQTSASPPMVNKAAVTSPEGPMEPEPQAQPRPNRQRQLTRPQRRSFYPYFFSRVLG